MPVDSYTFRVTIAGADAIKQAKEIRKAVEAEFQQVTMLELGNVPEAIAQIKELQAASRGVGKALTAGFRGAVKRLISDITLLQEQVNAVVRAGAGPVQEALKDLGVMGLDALEMVDAGSTQATQKMARLTNEIRGTQARIEALQQRIAELGAMPIVPAGSLTGEVRTLDELFKELTGYRMPQVRRLFRDMQQDLAPVTAEIEKQAEALRAKAQPQYERVKAELEELTAAHRALVDQQSQLRRGTADWRALEEESQAYKQAIYAADRELNALRSTLLGGGLDEAMGRLRQQQQQYLHQLAESTVWWKELTSGAGKHADIIDAVAKRNREAGAALAEMVASWEETRKLQTSISRGIGTMQRMSDKVELPPGTEGTLATLVIAEKALGGSTKLASDEIERQRKELNKLVGSLERASQAAEGMDRVQRKALQRIQMVAERELVGLTKERGITTEEAAERMAPVLARVLRQTEAIKNRTLAQVQELEAEGKRRQPFGWLVRAAQKAKALIVGESIIPDMVIAINEWLAKVGVGEPFTDLAMDANRAGEMIQAGLQTRLKQLNTDQAQAELKELQEELKRTATAIESQLVVSSQASQEYKRAFADYAAEVRRVRGDDPAAMALLARGKVLRGTGIRGEFKTMEIIDTGYQAICTEVEDRQRLSEEQTAKLLALETKHTALRQAALALDRELAQRRVASLEKQMATALDVEGDVDKFEALNKEYVIAQDRLGEITNEIAFERELITSRAIAAAEEQLAQAKAQARRTIPAGVGTEVAGAMIMPKITQTQVRNAREYAEAIRGVGKALADVSGELPLVTEAEQERLVATTRAMTQAEEAERRLTAVKRQQLRMQEIDKEKEAQAEVEAAKGAAQAEVQVSKALAAKLKTILETQAYEKKQQARAAAAAAIEEERRLTAQLKGEEARRTQEHQDEIRKRQQAERDLRRVRLEPTPAEIARYGGGRLGAISWAVQEAQMRQMGLRMLAYDIDHMSRSMMMASAAMTGPPILAMRRFVEYTRETDRAAAAMGLAREESVGLRHELIEQSQALAMASPEEIAAGLYTWATGVGATARNQQELQKVIEDTIPIQQLAYMQQIELAEAMEATAGILAEYQLETSETQRVVEILDATADRTFATVSDLGEAFKFVGPVAHDLGVSVEETAAAFGILADANIRSSMAGRAMRQMWIRLLKSTEEEDEALNKLLRRNAKLGQSWRDIIFPEGKFIGLAKWIDLLAAATENLTQEERGAVLATISTANELPALTAMVTRQIAARQHGINVIRAETKVRLGAIDDEVRAYADWEESLIGNIMSLESAHDAFARKVQQRMESESHQIDELKFKWDAAVLAMGEHTMQIALPALEKLADVTADIAAFVTENPWVVQAVLAAGGTLAAASILASTAGKLIRIVSMIRSATMMIEGWKAAQAMQTAAAATQTTAAGTQVAAADTQVAAAQLQATSAGGLGRSIMRLVAVVAAVFGGFEIGLGITNIVRGARGEEALGQREALGQIGAFIGQLAAMTAGTGGMLTAWLLGEDPAEAFAYATTEAGRLFGLIQDEEEQIKDGAEETGDELRDWNVELERARRKVQGLGSDLMQLPPTGIGLAAFTEEELQAIDELEDYLQRRNDLIEKQNEDLLKMEEEFREKEAEQYQEHLEDRAKLEAELRKVREEPLWKTTKEAVQSEQRQREAMADAAKRIQEIIADHQKKLRNLSEDHEDKMEDLEAQRDAKGIIAERRRYSRAIRDASEQKDAAIRSAEERRDKTIKIEREKIETLRKERQEDLEEKLRELDENYQKEALKRQADFEKRYQEKQVQNQRELEQLERAHAERLARIMGWEERIREALRKSYIGREQDLRQHLSQMEQLYFDTFGSIGQALASLPDVPDELRDWNVELERARRQAQGYQAGGYAGPGTYRLGETGREFVLSASTTRAMERAIGHLSQARLMSLAQGGTGGHFRLDIHVTADDHFSPAFAAQTEAIVQREIVNLSSKVAGSQPGAYRMH